MEILSIKLKSKKNPNIFLCLTESGEFDLHSDIIVKFNLSVGCVDDEKFFIAKKESDEIIAFNLATKYVGSRLKTEQQIKDYLYKKNYHKNTVDVVIEKMKEYKIIDDKNYAETYARSNPNYSKNKLKQKLFSFGVKAHDVDESLAEIDDIESCKKNAEKYVRSKILDKQMVEKLIRRLLSMGYTWEVIKSTLNYLKCNLEE